MNEHRVIIRQTLTRRWYWCCLGCDQYVTLHRWQDAYEAGAAHAGIR